MPKSTFTNLQANKRKLVQDICLKEFASYSFAEASVSRIVKNLGIAKGSIYQYFDDKSDLYAYLIELSLNRKYEILNYIATKVSDDIYLWLFQTCLVELKFAREFPEMQKLLNRAELESDSPIRERENKFVEDNLRRFLQGIGQKELALKVFLISTVKKGIIDKFTDSDLSDQVVNEFINPITKAIINSVTNQS
ncbi:MAG: TetR/AcrR family transcriptional regulator [Bacteroidota bacterium]